jgi:hypothetical protein
MAAFHEVGVSLWKELERAASRLTTPIDNKLSDVELRSNYILANHTWDSKEVLTDVRRIAMDRDEEVSNTTFVESSAMEKPCPQIISSDWLYALCHPFGFFKYGTLTDRSNTFDLQCLVEKIARACSWEKLVRTMTR